MMPSHDNKVNNTNGKENDRSPRVIIVEQPSSKGLRFRYECEKKYAAAIIGVNSKSNTKTFPTIKILNWKGPVRVVVSCVTKDAPYKPHPHNLLGKIKVADGICQFELEKAGPALCFENLSIQCVKKKDIEKSLALREKLGVDPFKTGFDHATNPNSIDLYSLRLCFEVFLEGDTPGVFDKPLEPVVTNPINDRRGKTGPEIVYVTRREGPVTGGEELGILCERADREDIEVLFYREESNWEVIAPFHKLGVFRRVAIVIKTPPYEDDDIKEPVEVKILLRKCTTGDVSEPFPYTYLPGKINPLKRKRNHYTYNRPSEPLQKEIERKADKILPENIYSGNAFNLPARESKGKPDARRELQSIPDLSANAPKYPDPHGSTSTNTVPKNMTDVNNLHDENVSVSKGEQDIWDYSNTLNSDDWIHDLLETIQGDSAHKNSQIVKEPEIQYITPDPMPNIMNSTPAMQHHNHFISNNNNNQGIPSNTMPVFIENFQHLPQHFSRDLHTLTNIQKQRERPPVGNPQGYNLMHSQPPQYAVNINGNQWTNVLNNVTNKQPLTPTDYQYLSAQQANISQMCVDDNFNGHSENYIMNNGSYGAPMQLFNEENTWHQIQRETVNEFDPLCPTPDTWRSNQQYNGFTQ